MEECCGFLADEVEAAAVVDVFDVVPGDALCPVLLLQGETQRKWVSKYLKGRWVTRLRQTQHLLRNLEVSICWLFVAEQLHRNSWRFAFLDAFSWRIKWKGPRFFQHWGIQGDKPALNLTKRHPDYSNKKKSVASLQYKTNKSKPCVHSTKNLDLWKQLAACWLSVKPQSAGHVYVPPGANGNWGILPMSLQYP